LPELHGAALKFAKDTEDLLGGFGLCLRSGIFCGHTPEALA
jgi:hypothetical protein